MDKQPLRKFHDPQAGGVTILVVLLLLVLLTVSVLGMSRNAMREIVITANQRQGVEVRNVADSGVEWAIHWLNEPSRNARIPDAGAQALIQEYDQLTTDVNLLGEVRTLSAVPSSAMITSIKSGAVVRTYDLQIIRMGELEMPMVSQTPGVVVQKPIIWSIRADADLQFGGMGFQHSRESWVAAPPPGAIGN